MIGLPKTALFELFLSFLVCTCDAVPEKPGLTGVLGKDGTAKVSET